MYLDGLVAGSGLGIKLAAIARGKSTIRQTHGYSHTWQTSRWPGVHLEDTLHLEGVKSEDTLMPASGLQHKVAARARHKPEARANFRCGYH